ncbi:hypothetical protein CJ030_MR0G027275 [Morella rubra]|uniref:Uncharacterized protein n=1 Tax=Morella rubra TaxID=262757 RepID=A0A6A1UGT9_9ROSI|nr:hypothetical protein CJ030_MR0G027275 [Morella rubra]
MGLPKWERSMVEEERTGEVFVNENCNTAMQWAFPSFNVALKGVSHILLTIGQPRQKF